MASSEAHPLQQLYELARWRIRSISDFKAASLFTVSNYINFFILITFVGLAIYQARSKVEQAKADAVSRESLPAKDFPEIERLDGFSWKDEQPFKIQNRKPKYHVTMVDDPALQKLSPSELILMDKNYLDRITYRKRIIKSNPDTAISVHDDRLVAPAVRELYTFLMATYLPKRYPSMFKLHKASFDTGDSYLLENLVTKEMMPAQALRPSPTSTSVKLLDNLGRTLDEDFLILVAEDADRTTTDTDETLPKYVLQAYVTVCPSGFNPREKLGMRLADIHSPVPGYSSILQGSMDRYFAKLQVGEYVKRSNWNVTTNPELFVLPGESGNHAHEGDVVEELDSIDPDKTWLRCERQTLHRLPKSKAIVFAFKTYMYTLTEIKEEGLGEELAEAIDGLRLGNTPGMHFYKRGAVWGEAVKRYLRS